MAVSNSKASETEIRETFESIAAGSIVIGIIVGLDADGRPLVDFNNNPESNSIVAITTSPITKRHLSRQVALLFNNGDLNQPVIIGLIHNPLDELIENFELTLADHENADPFPECDDEVRNQAEIKTEENNHVYVDGKQVCIEGSEEVTFKCGKASITLTKSGKILIRGTYLLNRSTGVNRIMGGSVQVN
jgi:hypothetical protein